VVTLTPEITPGGQTACSTHATPAVAKVSECRHLDAAPSIMDAGLASPLDLEGYKKHPAWHCWKMTARLRYAEKPHTLWPAPALQRCQMTTVGGTERLRYAEKPFALGPILAPRHCHGVTARLRYAEKPHTGPTPALQHCQMMTERLRYADKPFALGPILVLQHCREVTVCLKYAEASHALRPTLVDKLHLKMKWSHCLETGPPLVVAEASALWRCCQCAAETMCISLVHGLPHQ